MPKNKSKKRIYVKPYGAADEKIDKDNQLKISAKKKDEKRQIIAQHYESMEKQRREMEYEEKIHKLERDEQACLDSANLVRRLNAERKQRADRLYKVFFFH